MTNAPTSLPRVDADAHGVWETDERGSRSGYRWEEVYRVYAYKLDIISAVRLMVGLDTSYGEYMELIEDLPGFAEAAATFHLHLPGLPRDWLKRAGELTLDDEPEVFWQREQEGSS